MSLIDDRSGPCPLFPILPRFRQQLTDALALLLQAYICARDAHASLWDFGVEIASLRDLGVSNTILRWLSLKSAIQHRVELSDADGSDRTFRKVSPVKFTSHSVLVLTDDGYSLAERLGLLSSIAVSTPQNGTHTARDRSPPDPDMPLLRCMECRPSAEQAGESRIPIWDANRRELWFEGQLVKRFRLPAPNQESILMAFQEACWPTRIDDPLPSQPSQLAQGRLRSTISALNRSQINALIKFRGDGTGEGVLWESDCLAELPEPG